MHSFAHLEQQPENADEVHQSKYIGSCPRHAQNKFKPLIPMKSRRSTLSPYLLESKHGRQELNSYTNKVNQKPSHINNQCMARNTKTQHRQTIVSRTPVRLQDYGVTQKLSTIRSPCMPPSPFRIVSDLSPPFLRTVFSRRLRVLATFPR